MTRPIKHIAIVGCGFTGTSAFYQLVRSFPVQAITIFEASGEFGPGYAYQTTECDDYLINNTTDTMCLEPDNRRAFLDWLEVQSTLDVDLSPKGHLPRNIYGLFLKDVVATTRRAAEARGIACQLIPAMVTRVDEDEKSTVTLSWDGGDITADAVLMTTGRCPDMEFISVSRSTPSAQYFDNHVGSAALDDLKLDADVHIMGASLSAYDIINRLYSETTGCRFERGLNDELTFVAGPNQRRTTLYSRSGRLKKMQSRLPQTIKRAAFTLSHLRPKRPVSLSGIAEAICQDGKEHGAVIDRTAIAHPYKDCHSPEEVNERAGALLASDIQAAITGNGANFLVDVFDDAQVEIWDGFAEGLISVTDEQLYRQAYETALQSFAASCPVPTAERLLALHRAGRVTFRHGAGTPVLSERGAHFDIPYAYGTAHAEVLINATGKVDRNVLSKRQPAWVQAMVAAGSLHPYERDGAIMAGADIDMATLRPPSLNRVYFANMMLWGPGFFTSSARMMALMVSRILATIFDE